MHGPGHARWMISLMLVKKGTWTKFIKEGYDVNKTSERFFGRRTPLMYAAGEGRFDVVKYLIDHGADVSKKAWHE